MKGGRAAGGPPLTLCASLIRVNFCSNCGARLAGLAPVTCQDCGTTHYLNAKPCGGALLVHEGRLLLVRRAIEPWRGRWDIPGGFCDQREHPRDAAERELWEETGIRGRATRLVGLWVDEYDGDQVCLNVYYEMEPVDGVDPHTGSDEVFELGWFGPDELPLGEISFPDHCRAVLESWRRAQNGGASS